MNMNANLFKREISFINHSENAGVIQMLVIKALDAVPEGVFKHGASSTGKYHPPYAQGEYGLLRHVQAAVWFAHTLLELDMYNGFTPQVKDEIIAALILHDSCKYGLHDECKYVCHDHPILVEQLLNYDSLTFNEGLIWEDLSFLVSSHMGQWTTSNRSSVVLPAPTTDAQKFVHLCDYLASRKELDVKIFGEMPTEENREAPVSKVVSQPKVYPATENQKGYLLYLINSARKLENYPKEYDSIEVEDLSSNQASWLIAKLKELLPSEDHAEVEAIPETMIDE